MCAWNFGTALLRYLKAGCGVGDLVSSIKGEPKNRGLIRGGIHLSQENYFFHRKTGGVQND